MTNIYDIVIRGGMIVDGTGGKPFSGDIAIRGNKIAAIGVVSGRGGTEIDAVGRIVTPGFVDIHTHYDGQVTWENTLAPSSGHGITTVVMGNCGVGFAPVRASERQLAMQLMEGVEEIPGIVMETGVPFNWETFPEYLDVLAQKHTDVDFAAQLPHSPLRVFVMGERGANREPPTNDDLAEMRRLTAEAIRAGALGVTTSRNISHRFPDGRPTPSTNSEEDELMSLAAGLRDVGSGVFQLNPNMQKPGDEEFALIRRLALASGRPVSFALVTSEEFCGGWRVLMDGLAAAKREGLPIRGQMLPRPIGMLFGLDLTFHAFSLNPSYRAIESLPLQEKLCAMRNPEMRRRLLEEEPEGTSPFSIWIVKQTHNLYQLGDPPNYLPSSETSIEARAAAAGVAEREMIYDWLLEDEGRAVLYHPLGNMSGGRIDAAAELLGKPGTVLGLGDGGAHYGSVCDAAYTTFVLTCYVRDANAEYSVPLERAISMLARETAEAVGLNDRGVLKPGFKADINVIDMDRLYLHAPHVKRDLPAGGRRLIQRADGYEATIVSGEITYLEGQATGAFPGRLVRGAQEAPN
jgi:N-acyl-D-amino-acid deacylase